MTQKTPVVVLRPATFPGGSEQAWTEAWAAHGRTALVPDLAPPPGLVVLEAPGLEVLAALSASGADRAVLCGSGYGAMVALHVAANYPEQVAALVLTTANRIVDRQRRGIADAVYGLLPVTRVQQLRGPQGRVLELLDQVRTVDWTPFASAVGHLRAGRPRRPGRHQPRPQPSPRRRAARVRAARRPRREGGLGQSRPRSARRSGDPVPGPARDLGRRPAVNPAPSARSGAERSQKGWASAAAPSRWRRRRRTASPRRGARG